MMDHEHIQTLLSDYMEGSLAPDEQQAVREHLASCQACNRSLRLLSRTLSVVRQMPQAEAPPRFARRLQRRAVRAGLISRRRQRLLTRVTSSLHSSMTMAVLLAALGGLLVFALFAHQQIELYTHATRMRMALASSQQLADTANMAWQLGAKITIQGQLVSPTAPPAQWKELEISLQRERWPAFHLAFETMHPNHLLPEVDLKALSETTIRILITLSSPPDDSVQQE